MKCPVCENNLTQVQAGGVTVDVCLGGCGGIWFDNFELKKLDEPQEMAGQFLVNIKRRDDVQVDPTMRRSCPRCHVVMMRHFFSPRRRVEVDECPSCGGYWLDAGELALIREEHQNEQEKLLAVDQFLTDASTQTLSPMRSQGGDQANRARRIDQLFRFSRPIRFQHE